MAVRASRVFFDLDLTEYAEVSAWARDRIWITLQRMDNEGIVIPERQYMKIVSRLTDHVDHVERLSVNDYRVFRSGKSYIKSTRAVQQLEHWRLEDMAHEFAAEIRRLQNEWPDRVTGPTSLQQVEKEAFDYGTVRLRGRELRFMAWMHGFKVWFIHVKEENQWYLRCSPFMHERSTEDALRIDVVKAKAPGGHGWQGQIKKFYPLTETFLASNEGRLHKFPPFDGVGDLVLARIREFAVSKGLAEKKDVLVRPQLPYTKLQNMLVPSQSIPAFNNVKNSNGELSEAIDNNIERLLEDNALEATEFGAEFGVPCEQQNAKDYCDMLSTEFGGPCEQQSTKDDVDMFSNENTHAPPGGHSKHGHERRPAEDDSARGGGAGQVFF